MHKKIKGLLWIIFAGALAFLSFSGFTFGLRQIPRSLENRLGHSLLSFPKNQVCSRPDAQAALDKLLVRIYPQSADEKVNPLSVAVLHGGPVNAFASLGTQIYVYENLIQTAKSPEELAGVIAHEIGHVTERHVLESVTFRVLSSSALTLVFGTSHSLDPQMFEALAQLKFSRAQEHEADVDGYERLQKSMIDTKGMAEFFERIEHIAPKDSTPSPSLPEFLSDHPRSTERAQLAGEYPVKNPVVIMSNEEWQTLQSICHS